MTKKLLSLLLVAAMLFSCCFLLLVACQKDVTYTVTFDVGSAAREAGVSTPEPQKVAKGGKLVQPTNDAWEGHTLVGWYNGGRQWNFSTDTVTSNMTLTATWRVVELTAADKYEEELTWGEPRHLYIHYLRGAHDENEQGIFNNSEAPNYNTPIGSEVYGDWGLWVWPFAPKSGEGRAFYPMKIDASGAVYDIDLDQVYDDAGWDADTRSSKNLTITYTDCYLVGIQIFSQDSRVNGEGFWVNDGGDVFVFVDEDTVRENGDYHWFVSQGSVQDGSPRFTGEEINDPYEGLEPGSATSKRDVVSNMGTNDVYEQQPVAEGWEYNSVGYQIFIASFADSDGDGMGDIRGIIEKLDYLEDLGVDTLWLTPFQSSNSYHGYDIMDYFSVDPRFGTLDDYRELIYKAHSKGMKVLLDFVLNHTSLSNPWFAKSQGLVKETITLPDGTKKEIDYRNFYNWQNEEYVSKLSPLAKSQWYKDANGYYFYSSFGSSMPELNFDYQATRDAILDVALYWMSFGLDGFRLDAVKHIYMVNENDEHSGNIVQDISSSGDYSFDMDKNVHFFREFNAKLKATYPNALLVGENFNGNPANLAPLYDSLDSQFNFNFYYDTTRFISKGMADSILNQYVAAQNIFSEYRSDYIDGVFTSNHDVQRARDRVGGTFVGDENVAGVPLTAIIGDSDWTRSEELAKMYAALALTVPGMTWIYNGDELGMFGTKRDNPQGDGAGHEDRWCRQPMKWTTTLEDSSYNCYYLMGFNNYYMTWDALNMQLYGVAEQSAQQNSMLNVYKGLIAVRKSNPVMARGTVVPHLTGGSVVCYSITDGTNEILVSINIGNKTSGIGYTLPASATQLYVYGGATTSTIDGMSIAIYKVK